MAKKKETKKETEARLALEKRQQEDRRNEDRRIDQRRMAGIGEVRPERRGIVRRSSLRRSRKDRRD